MPFGLRNAARTFQRFIDEVFKDLLFTFPYLNKVLIAIKSEEKHFGHIRQVFHRLEEYSISINKDKCTFGFPEINFLGYTISAQGIAPVQEKSEAIRNFPLPNDQKALRHYLGMVNYYRQFIPSCAEVLSPLHKMITLSKKSKSIKLTWTTEQNALFKTQRKLFSMHEYSAIHIHLLS